MCLQDFNIDKFQELADKFDEKLENTRKKVMGVVNVFKRLLSGNGPGGFQKKVAKLSEELIKLPGVVTKLRERVESFNSELENYTDTDITWIIQIKATMNRVKHMLQDMEGETALYNQVSN